MFFNTISSSNKLHSFPLKNNKYNGILKERSRSKNLSIANKKKKQKKIKTLKLKTNTILSFNDLILSARSLKEYNLHSVIQ